MWIVKRLGLALVSIPLLLGGTAFGQTVVHENTDGDLRVIKFTGKPPYKRQTIAADEQSDFAQYEQLADSVLVATSTSRRVGPPGKMLPRQQASFDRVPREEITRLARFEESEAAARDTRLWRGAPGKGRRLPGR